MYTKQILIAVLFAAVSSLPSCPAPPALLPALVGIPRILSRDVKNSTAHDGIPHLEGANDYNVKMCIESNENVDMDVNKTSANSYRLKGATPSCMVLAGAFVNDKGRPVPCGNDCLDYVDLSQKDIDTLESVIGQLE